MGARGLPGVRGVIVGEDETDMAGGLNVKNIKVRGLGEVHEKASGLTYIILGLFRPNGHGKPGHGLRDQTQGRGLLG